MKHFIDIDIVRDDLSNEMIAPNIMGFNPGDNISVTEKIDGANASIRYEDGVIKAFSRKQELGPFNTLKGFYEYTQSLNPALFEPYKDYVIFGEWLVKHAVKYDKEAYDKWYVYDIFDAVNCKWMAQDFVKDLCAKTGLEYVHIVYEGPFKSWAHIKELALTESAYGAKEMEGVVVKNQDRVGDENTRLPFYLKYVNKSFSETKAHRVREVDPEKEAARAEGYELMKTICTKNRVRKEIFKCIDEGLLTPPFAPKDMAEFAKLIPKRIYQDLMKEELDTLIAVGEPAGKMSGSLTMQYVRELILGGELNE